MMYIYIYIYIYLIHTILSFSFNGSPLFSLDKYKIDIMKGFA